MTRAEAAPLISLAHRIGSEGACAQRRDIAALQRRAAALVNAGRVPRELQDTFMSGVNALSADTPPCVPAVIVRTPAPPPRRPADHRHAHEPGHGKHEKHKEKH